MKNVPDTIVKKKEDKNLLSKSAIKRKTLFEWYRKNSECFSTIFFFLDVWKNKEK